MAHSRRLWETPSGRVAHTIQPIFDGAYSVRACVRSLSSETTALGPVGSWSSEGDVIKGWNHEYEMEANLRKCMLGCYRTSAERVRHFPLSPQKNRLVYRS
jgi:hypothetical protein